MKITAKYHVTATEKRAIKQIISRGWLAGSTKRKSYQLVKTDSGFDVTIKTPETDSAGRRIVRRSFATVEMGV